MPHKRKRPGRSRKVREPLQVYLTTEERHNLDRLAGKLGLSRAEVLRRGLHRFAAEVQGADSPMLRLIERLAGTDFPADYARRHDDYLADIYMDNHET